MSVFTTLLKQFAFNYAHHELASNGRLQLVDSIEESPIGPIYSAFDHEADQPSWFAVLCILKPDDGSMDAGIMEALKLLSRASHPEVVRPWSVFEETIDNVEFAFLVIDYLDEYVSHSTSSISSTLTLSSSERDFDEIRTPVSSLEDLSGSGKFSGKERKAKGFLAKMARKWF
jgi:hypothetical protein